jgi:hypothetical protein
MRWNKLVRSFLKTAVYLIDQTADQVDRVSDRAVAIADDAKQMVSPSEDHTLRNIVSFAAGIGVGVGTALLLTPASGQEIRSSISGRVHDISSKVRGRGETYPTGTD